jgi:hypothetical protein
VPFIPVPGVAQTTLKGLIGANPWAVTFHWKAGPSTSPWTQADIQVLATAGFTAWSTALKGNSATNVSITECDALDLSNTTGVGFNYTATPVNGILSGGVQPSSLCMVISNKIADRYRGGHPRTFWPCGTQSQMSGEAAWTTSFQNSLAANQATYVSTVRAAAYSFGTTTLNHVVPRYSYTYTSDPVKHKWTKERTALLDTPTVSSYVAVAKTGSQRRRLTP